MQNKRVFRAHFSAIQFGQDGLVQAAEFSHPAAATHPFFFNFVFGLFSFSLCIVSTFVFSSALLAEGTVTGVTSPARLTGCCQGNKCPFYEWEANISQAEGWGLMRRAGLLLNSQTIAVLDCTGLGKYLAKDTGKQSGMSC